MCWLGVKPEAIPANQVGYEGFERRSRSSNDWFVTSHPTTMDHAATKVVAMIEEGRCRERAMPPAEHASSSARRAHLTPHQRSSGTDQASRSRGTRGAPASAAAPSRARHRTPRNAATAGAGGEPERGVNVRTLPSVAERARIRNRAIGFIFQAFNLIGDLTVSENVELPLTYRGMSAAERTRRVREALERVGMRHRARHYPQQLSGGQQQRVAVARGGRGDRQ
jgi:energy-coupling factor transporter ATP-binding protein EcfA2